MSIVSPPEPITLEQFLAIPTDNYDRELIRGEIKERPMTRRNRFHARAEARLSRFVGNWVAEQTTDVGDVYSGEVGCILARDPDSNVGIDVAWFSAETIARQTDATSMIEGLPILAIEILSPSDVVSEVSDKVNLYLENAVALVWIVDPYFKTVTVHRPGTAPVLFNINQTLTDDAHLPGLSIPVAEIFA